MSTANIRQINSQSLNGGQFGGLRNLLINATFKINQRSYVSGIATTTANQYTLDRWRVPASGQNATFTANGARNIVTAPASGIEQVIEGDNIFGGTYTVSWEGTASCYINGVEVTKGSQVTLIGGTDATVKFVGGSVELPQLEHGIRDTEFEHRWRGPELALCHRYYETFQYSSGGQGSGTGAVVDAMFMAFTVPKRSIPTVSRSGGAFTNVASVSIDTVTSYGCRILFTTAAAGPWAGINDTLVVNSEF